MKNVLINNSFEINGTVYTYKLTKSQLVNAIKHGGTKTNDHKGIDIQRYRHSLWLDNSGAIGHLLPNNIYATTRVFIKRNDVIVHLPYYVSRKETGEHIAIFNKTTLQLLDTRIGSGPMMPYVVCTGDTVKLVAGSDVLTNESRGRVNDKYAELSKLRRVLGVAH